MQTPQEENPAMYSYAGQYRSVFSPIFAAVGVARTELQLPAETFPLFFQTFWPACSKLTTSLVNVSLKFQMLISEIRHYFLLKKMWAAFAMQKLLTFFQTKNISVFGYKVVKHLTS